MYTFWKGIFDNQSSKRVALLWMHVFAFNPVFPISISVLCIRVKAYTCLQFTKVKTDIKSIYG